MSVDTIYRIQLRRGISTDWDAVNPILGDGEPGFERDSGMVKIGDGLTHWADLPYLSAEGADVVTPPIDDNDTSIATTEWFMNQASNALPLALSDPAAPGTSKRWSREDHRHLDQYVNTAGDTMEGTLVVEHLTADSEIIITSPEQNSRLVLDSRSGMGGALAFRSNTEARWVLQRNATPEIGSDSGSDLQLIRYDDNGVSKGNVLTIIRGTGLATVYPPQSGGVTVPLNDTGWRTVTGNLINGWGGSLHIRRVGNFVSVRVSSIVPSTSTNTSFYNCPAGFVPQPGMFGLLGTGAAGGALVRHVLSYNTTYLQMPTRLTSDSSFVGTLHWYTDDPWPTSLPGAAFP